ncbi:MAG: hypothetical protein WCT08_00245 [Patescibacteria group bacterium]|jgi:hypothetical protein
MLSTMGIRFHHHVALPCKRLNRERKQKTWHPDFVLDSLQRWIDPVFYSGSVILGIEVKRTFETYGEEAVSSARDVQQNLGIPVLIINRKRIEKYLSHNGRLPLKPLVRAA